MRKIVGPSACPGERAHGFTSIVILEPSWSLSFKAEILVTAVTNWTLLYHTCRKSYTTNNLGVPVKHSNTNHFLCIPLRVAYPEDRLPSGAPGWRKNLAGWFLKKSCLGDRTKVRQRNRKLFVEVRRGAGTCDDPYILGRVLDSALCRLEWGWTAP